MTYNEKQTAALNARLAAHGFAPVDLAGGRTGYLRTDGQISELIQNADDPGQLPGLTSNTDVYVMTGDLEPGNPIRVTLANVLAALDDPRDEYALLDLRIHNHYGNAWPGHVYGE